MKDCNSIRQSFNTVIVYHNFFLEGNEPFTKIDSPVETRLYYRRWRVNQHYEMTRSSRNTKPWWYPLVRQRRREFLVSQDKTFVSVGTLSLNNPHRRHQSKPNDCPLNPQNIWNYSLVTQSTQVLILELGEFLRIKKKREPSSLHQHVHKGRWNFPWIYPWNNEWRILRYPRRKLYEWKLGKGKKKKFTSNDGHEKRTPIYPLQLFIGD